MNKFNVIQGELEERQGKLARRIEVELDAYERMVDRMAEENVLSIGTKGLSIADERLKLAYAVIRFVDCMDDAACTARYDIVLTFYELVTNMLIDVPVADFMRWFPITKEYDGERWGSKDYFSTIKYLKEKGYLEVGAVIDDPRRLLFAYQNPYIFDFDLKFMCAVSDGCQAKGKETPIEKLCKENNLPMYTMNELPNGKTLLTDDKGNQHVISKIKPKHLKVIHG